MLAERLRRGQTGRYRRPASERLRMHLAPSVSVCPGLGLAGDPWVATYRYLQQGLGLEPWQPWQPVSAPIAQSITAGLGAWGAGHKSLPHPRLRCAHLEHLAHLRKQSA